MGLQVLDTFLLALALHCASGKLMYVNGILQKDLTPVKPHEVDAFISGLQLYAQVVRREVGGGPEPQKSAKTPGQVQNCTSKEEEEPKVSTTHALTNSSRLLERDGTESTSGKTELPANFNPHRLERGVISSGSDVLDSIHSLLGMLKKNSSNPAFFFTNFASSHNDETDE